MAARRARPVRRDVVVKDPRIGLVPAACGSRRAPTSSARAPRFVTMLRHPAEILASARKSYGTWQTDASRAAAWLNVMLETERATRGTPRAFVRYEDLLADWRRRDATASARTLDATARSTAIAPEREAVVDGFVDPKPAPRPRRLGRTRGAGSPCASFAERVWGLFLALAGPEVTPRVLVCAARRGARGVPPRSTREAEAITQPSVTAVPAAQEAKQPPPTLRVKTRPADPEAPSPRSRLRRLAGRFYGKDQRRRPRLQRRGVPRRPVWRRSSRQTVRRPRDPRRRRRLEGRQPRDRRALRGRATTGSGSSPRPNGGLGAARNTGIEAAVRRVPRLPGLRRRPAADPPTQPCCGPLETTGSDFATGNVHRFTATGAAPAPFLTPARSSTTGPRRTSRASASCSRTGSLPTSSSGGPSGTSTASASPRGGTMRTSRWSSRRTSWRAAST